MQEMLRRHRGVNYRFCIVTAPSRRGLPFIPTVSHLQFFCADSNCGGMSFPLMWELREGGSGVFGVGSSLV
jgi:hypothetical protein